MNVTSIHSQVTSSVKFTSLGNRDDCVYAAVCYGDGGFRDLRQQVHQVAYAVVNNPPVSGEAPEMQGKEYIMYTPQNKHNLIVLMQLRAVLTDQWYACMKSLIATCLLAWNLSSLSRS